MATPPRITLIEPLPGAVVTSPRHRIYALFTAGAAPIDAGGVRLLLNGEDVTTQAAVNASFITYTPVADLPVGPVEVEVQVQDAGGLSDGQQWQFTVQACGAEESLVAALKEEVEWLRHRLSRKDAEMAVVRQERQQELESLQAALAESNARLHRRQAALYREGLQRREREREWQQEEAFLREQVEQQRRAHADLLAQVAARSSETARLLARWHADAAAPGRWTTRDATPIRWSWRSGKVRGSRLM